jgi:hypothetical protein
MLEAVILMNDELKKQAVTDNDLVVWKCESCEHKCTVMWENDIGFGLDRCLLFGIYTDSIPKWEKVE